MNPERQLLVTDETARASVDEAFRAAYETDESSAHPNKMIQNGLKDIGGRVPGYKEVHDDSGNSVTVQLTPELNVTAEGINHVLPNISGVVVRRHGQNRNNLHATALDGSGAILRTRYDRFGKVVSKDKYLGAGPKTAQKVIQAAALAIKDSAEARRSNH